MASFSGGGRIRIEEPEVTSTRKCSPPPSDVPPGIAESPYAGMTKAEVEFYSDTKFFDRLRKILLSLLLLSWIAMIAAVIGITVVFPRCSPPPHLHWWQSYVYVDLTNVQPNSGETYLEAVGRVVDGLSELEGNAIVIKDLQENAKDPSSIDPQLGNEEQWQEISRIASSKKIQLVMPFNVNDRSATSDWFKTDLSDFLWENCAAGTPNDWKRKDGASMWTPGQGANDQCFLSQTGFGRADLNLRNNDVSAKLIQGIKSWVDRGIKGFIFSKLDLGFEDYELRNIDNNNNNHSSNKTFMMLEDMILLSGLSHLVPHGDDNNDTLVAMDLELGAPIGPELHDFGADIIFPRLDKVNNNNNNKITQKTLGDLKKDLVGAAGSMEMDWPVFWRLLRVGQTDQEAFSAEGRDGELALVSALLFLGSPVMDVSVLFSNSTGRLARRLLEMRREEAFWLGDYHVTETEGGRDADVVLFQRRRDGTPPYLVALNLGTGGAVVDALGAKWDPGVRIPNAAQVVMATGETVTAEDEKTEYLSDFGLGPKSFKIFKWKTQVKEL